MDFTTLAALIPAKLSGHVGGVLMLSSSTFSHRGLAPFSFDGDTNWPALHALKQRSNTRWTSKTGSVD